MDNRIHVSFNANDRSYFAILKKEIHLLAVGAGLNDKKVGEIDIVVSEIVSNLVKHGGGGQLLVKVVNEENKKGIELLSIDNGVGMTDVTRMVADGVSTKNSLGQGLGAMKRLSDVFQVYSLKNWGTIILCRLFESEHTVHKNETSTEIRSVILPKTNEKACGDGFCSIVTNKEIRLFSGDGLGHGPEAELAVVTAIEAFKKCTERSSVEVVRFINSEVRKTRGLVGTAAIFRFDERKWNICGIGNIQTKINSLDSANGYMSYNGIIGLNMPNTLKEREFTYEQGQHMIMCSDGIKSKWDTTRYPAILRYDPSILAAAILKDYARHTDDMSVAVCKLNLS